MPLHCLHLTYMVREETVLWQKCCQNSSQSHNLRDTALNPWARDGALVLNRACSSVEDVFLCMASDLLVNLTETRPEAAIETLATKPNDMFKDSHCIGNAMGPALQAAYKLIVSLLLRFF